MRNDMKILLFIVLLTSLTFGQSGEMILFDDEVVAYTPPTGYEFFITSDGDTLKTSDGDYFLVRTVSQFSYLDMIRDDQKYYATIKNYRGMR